MKDKKDKWETVGMKIVMPEKGSIIPEVESIWRSPYLLLLIAQIIMLGVIVYMVIAR